MHISIHLAISLNTVPVWVLSYLDRMQHAGQHAGQHPPLVYISMHSKGAKGIAFLLHNFQCKEPRVWIESFLAFSIFLGDKPAIPGVAQGFAEKQRHAKKRSIRAILGPLPLNFRLTPQ